jgi:hypothetical protein
VPWGAVGAGVASTVIDSEVAVHMSSTTARLSTDHQPRLALALALLGVPGSTIAWDLPAGGFWIGMPLAVAAIAIGLRARADAGATGRRMAAAAIVLGAIEILFTVAWTVAG